MRSMVAGMFLMIAAITGQAEAQSANPAANSAMVSAGASGLEYNGAASLRAGSDPLHATLETPTMRREKLARAVALRDEALLLQERDGGVLSDMHARYVQRKARDILTYSGIRPGTWVTRFR